ncbi:MAG: HAD family phosphatase [Verrucomicrobiota bacterium]
MAKTFLFDIGNVILFFDFQIAAQKIASESNLSPADALKEVSPLTDDLETGLLDPETFIEKASFKIGYSGTQDRFREAFEAIFELNESMVQFITERHAEGASLHLLSNTNGIHVPYFESAYRVFDLFEGRIYSHQVGCMKPDPEIYEITINQLGINPSETIYIDDLPANCEAGRQVGLTTIPYQRGHHECFLSSYRNLIA